MFPGPIAEFRVPLDERTFGYKNAHAVSCRSRDPVGCCTMLSMSRIDVQDLHDSPRRDFLYSICIVLKVKAFEVLSNSEKHFCHDEPMFKFGILSKKKGLSSKRLTQRTMPYEYTAQYTAAREATLASDSRRCAIHSSRAPYQVLFEYTTFTSARRETYIKNKENYYETFTSPDEGKGHHSSQASNLSIQMAGKDTSSPSACLFKKIKN